MCIPHRESQKMAAMATSLRYRVSAISAFCRPTIQTASITNRLIAIVHTKPVIAILVPKLVAMATSFSTSQYPSNTWFLGPIQAHNPNGISIGSAVCAQMTAECPHTLQWDSPYLFKISPSEWGSGPHGSLGPPKSSTQMVSRSVQLFLQRSLVWQTDRLTDHAIQLVTISRIYVPVRTPAMPPKNLKPGLVTSYDIWPGNREGLFWFQCFIDLLFIDLLRHLTTYLQPRDPHEALRLLRR